MLIRSISGLRGIVGHGLTPDTIVDYAAAFAARSGGGPIAVGRDGRPSGEGIEALVVGTLAACGVEVRRLGVVPTPSVQLAVETSDAAGGIAITASHNPAEWNGLKFLDAAGVFLGPDACADLFARVDRKESHYRDHAGIGAIVDAAGFAAEHVERTLALPFLDRGLIRRRNLSVVVDAVNASGSVIIPTLLEALGCRVIPLYCDGTGIFPHTPEPLPANLGDLCDAVRAHGADLGAAIDPDGDRLVLIDEHGEPIGEEYTITLAADFALGWAARSNGGSGGKPCVAVNLSTTRAVDDVAARHGGRVVRTPVGEINVVEGMKREGAVIGGEGSGGVILPALHYGRDALAGIAVTMQHLAEKEISLSALRASLPNYVIVKKKIEGIESGATAEIFARVAAAYAERGTIRTDDGVRIDLPEGWIHLRASNTEPIVRVIAEAATEEEAERLAGEAVGGMKG